MDFTDQIGAIAARLSSQVGHLLTEEATKNALVMPLIRALGFDVFDPLEVVPEFTADVGTKKGEKVDYAIMQSGQPIMLFECKRAGTNLDLEHASQLFRYFTVTTARVAVLTNGVEYRFFTDIDEPNKMDRRPFFVFSLESPKKGEIAELRRFSKSTFNLDEVSSVASSLKYSRGIRDVLARQLEEPSEEFTRFFVRELYDGRVSKSVMDTFQPLVRSALRQFISERIADRLQTALVQESSTMASGSDSTPAAETAAAVVALSGGPPAESVILVEDGVETTPEEIDGFNIVRAIVAQVMDVSRVFMRDAKSYCSVLIDNNNRRPLCRLRFNTGTKYLGLFDVEKNEVRVPLANGPVDIYQHSEALREIALRYVADAS